MAKAKIIFTDLPDGRVRTKVVFDPPIDNDEGSFATPAQVAVMRALELLKETHAESFEEEAAT